MKSHYEFNDDQGFKFFMKLLNKTKNKPNRVKDSLYKNLNMIDKIKFLFEDDRYFLKKLYPIFSKIIFITEVLSFVLSIVGYLVLCVILFEHNFVLGIISFIFTFLYIVVMFTHFWYIESGSVYMLTNTSVIIHYILLLLSSGLIFIFIEYLIFMYVCQGEKTLKNFIDKDLDQEFTNEFNQIFFDENKSAYLKHELIKNVWFDNQSCFIKFDYNDKYYEDHVYTLKSSNDDQFKRVLTDYITNHTSRELNFKQLISKLAYINHLTIINQSSQNIGQNEKDNEKDHVLFNQILGNQISKDEALKQQFESLHD